MMPRAKVYRVRNIYLNKMLLIVPQRETSNLSMTKKCRGYKIAVRAFKGGGNIDRGLF